MNDGEPLVTKHTYFIFIIFLAKHCKPGCRETENRTLHSTVKGKKYKKVPRKQLFVMSSNVYEYLITISRLFTEFFSDNNKKSTK